MEYHMQYNSKLPISDEKESFMEKGNYGKVNLKKKKHYLIALSVLVICIFACTTFYFSKSAKNDDLYKQTLEGNANDDYIINFILRTKNGKKFIASKLQELILNYDKKNDNRENKTTSQRFVKEKKCNDGRCGISPYGKNVPNVGIIPNPNALNTHIDTQFMMSNLESLNQFYMFIKKHGKEYKTPDEMQRRFMAFSENLKNIQTHNSNPNKLYKKGMNHFGDLTFEEFQKKYLTLKKIDFKTNVNKMPRFKDYEDIITKYKPEDGTFDYVKHDWRELNAVTPVKNQHMCGACWAFSTVGTVESQYAIRRNELVSLSEQEMVDCSFKNYGCNGGTIPLAYEDMLDLGGLCKENEYPYVDITPELCDIDRCKNKYKITTYTEIPQLRFKEAIKFIGPISVSICASNDFSFYEGGIFDGPCSISANHAVILVGYGMEEVYDAMTKKNLKHYYYLIRNSWGDKWGEKGYMKIETDEFGLQKTCGLGEQAFIPLIDEF
ncbi:cysteine proteinase gondepain 3 [Plasmodium gonderi]|uniref:Cysteine proteinase gondepain 3 n=1 Tax=Plasmodium gonderi TaxID=77519 RepID=A0A1Y1JLJ8_PLAGO|nr:cysteine proteinase gondepain 3 [Plasmodium gonderi]GAW80924.1 cysteine proteinase gondepain 3 [Plasmodium gonderi]